MRNVFFLKDGRQPEVIDAYYISSEEVNVTWSASFDVVNAHVVVEDRVNAIKHEAIAGWNERSKIFSVKPGPSYNASVTVYDSCRNNRTSLPYPVNDSLIKYLLAKNSSPTIPLLTDTCSPTMNSECFSHYHG